MSTDPVRTATAKRRTLPPPSVRPCAWPADHGQPRCPPILALTGQDDNAHARFANPSRCQRRDPSGVTICAHARCPNVRKPGPRPNVHAVVSGVHNGRHDRTAFRTPPAPSCPAGHRSLHSARHGEPEPMRTGERTNGTEGSRTSSIATTTKVARRDTPSPLLWGRRLRLGKPRLARRWQHCQRRRHVTTAATTQPLGVALPSKPRLGALLSSDEFGLSVERAAKLHPLCRGARSLARGIEEHCAGSVVCEGGRSMGKCCVDGV